MEQVTLKNGLRVVMEHIPYLRSVSVGVWVRAGSMLESPQENGLSHFMEHMAFKGTFRRSARQLAEEMDAVGGHMNAATSKLSTNYYVKVIDDDLPLALDILSDITIHPALDAQEMEKEKGVVLEEISMVEDSPEDVVYDVLARAVYGDQSLGQTILGEEKQISAYTVEDIQAFRKRHYSPRNAVVSLAGHFDREKVLEWLEAYFGSWTGDAVACYPAQIAVPVEKRLFQEKDTEQVHLCLGYRSEPLGSQHVYRLAVMNSILGGGMSSRLFQRIREELGMAYSVYTGPSAYPGCGDFTIYAATMPKNAKKVLEQIDVELKKLKDGGVLEKEFIQAKAQLKSSFILGLESAFNRMNAMGSHMILRGEVIPPEETIRGIERVTMDDVHEAVEALLASPRSMAVVGRDAQKYL